MDFDKFQQFQPKSLKEVLEESKQQQISEMKEFAESSKDYIQEWYQEHMQYLKENNSDSHAVQGGDDWNPSGATYNREGNRVVFYDVIGGNGDNEIDMDTRTHDVIDGGEGYDTIRGGWGNDVITGGENTRNSWPQQDLMYGEDGNDALFGDADDDLLDGGSGNDTLHGGDGTDTLKGGAGDDSYVIDDLLDIVDESAGSGIDEVVSSFSADLSSSRFTGVENLSLASGAGDLTATGDSAANILRGNEGENTLVGNGGVDTLIGGDGDDHYVISNTSSTIVEMSDDGEDSVLASTSSYTLPPHVEDLASLALPERSI